MIILASGSQARVHLLTACGVNFKICPADLDENRFKKSYLEQGLSPREIAQNLAKAKALHVSKRNPGWVLGADQTLEFQGQSINKSQNLEDLKTILWQLCGKTHRLYSAAALVRDEQLVWCDDEVADMTMRAFSEDYLDHYLDQCGKDLVQSLGGYQIEGLGLQLFEAISGDIFTIMGLPLMKTLKALRALDILPS